MVDELGDDDVEFFSRAFDIETAAARRAGLRGHRCPGGDVSSAAETAGPAILYLFPDSGAEAAGLQIQERIVSVDGDPCVSIRKIRGPEGTTVTLGVKSPGQDVREVVVERRRHRSHGHAHLRHAGPGRVGRLPAAAVHGGPGTRSTASPPCWRTSVRGRSRGLGHRCPIGQPGRPWASRRPSWPTCSTATAGTFFTRGETSPLDLPDSDLLGVLQGHAHRGAGGQGQLRRA